VKVGWHQQSFPYTPLKKTPNSLDLTPRALEGLIGVTNWDLHYILDMRLFHFTDNYAHNNNAHFPVSD
jgi:hypothetical protein